MTHRQAGLVPLALLVLSVAPPVHAQRLTPKSVEVLERWTNAVAGHVPGRPDEARAVSTVPVQTQRVSSRMLAVRVDVLVRPAPLEAQRLTLESADALLRWVQAVSDHKPGYPDAPARAVAGMTFGERLELSKPLPFFFRVLFHNVEPRSEVQARIAAAATTVRWRPGAEIFLKRAAVLHADAVVFARRFPPPPDDAPSVVPDSAWPPLLTNDRITLTRDAEVVDYARQNWNLPFARSLLALLVGEKPPKNSRDEFVGDWYHAVAAFLLATGMNADARPHLHESERVLPDDARLLFDRGTHAETFGLPIYQAIGDSAVPAEKQTNAEAERFYRRALAVDPSHVEARVRLARLLDHRGRHDEAAAEIDQALSARPLDVPGYYARIVAARIAASRGRYDEALQRYREASALYPGAQSALLGASHAALMLADMPQALIPIAELDASSAGDADPWMKYWVGIGRDVGVLLAALWGGAEQWR